VANVGVRPTFGGDREVVEAHLIGFDEDLYGASIGLAFAERIRPERRFDGPDALVAQIHRDIETALDLLA
jgi:riboflavin kinase/FMN adenylyltransferase